MLVKNWMKKEFLTLSSDDSITKAQELFDKHPDKRYIIVIDNGKLRGILTRREVFSAGTYATASQSVYEMKFFVEKVKVKDIMKRMPITINLNKTLEDAIKLGIENNLNFLPVVDDNGKVLGSISSKQLVELLFEILGMEKNFLETLVIEGIDKNKVEESFENLMKIFLDNSVYIWSMFHLESDNKFKLVLKLKIPNKDSFLKSLNKAGYNIKELERGNIWVIKED